MAFVVEPGYIIRLHRTEFALTESEYVLVLCFLAFAALFFVWKIFQLLFLAVGEQRALVVDRTGVFIPKVMAELLTWEEIDVIKMEVLETGRIPLGRWTSIKSPDELVLYVSGPYVPRSLLTRMLFPKKIVLRLKFVDANSEDISSAIRESEAQNAPS
jgi:hypothetical protein